MDVDANKRPVVKYAIRDQGPFVIMFKGQQDYLVNEHQIVKHLKDVKIEFRKIKRIVKTSKNVVKVEAEDVKWANKIADVKIQNINVFIPTEFVFREIIVFDLPTYMTNEMIKEDIEIKAASEIINVERINRWNFDLKVEEPTTRVKVTYRGNSIPKEVFVCKVVQNCAIYVRKPLFCKTCFSFGHLKKWCKGPNCCLKCFDKHDESVACREKKCRYCTEDHKTGSRDCNETKKQWAIARIMATERCSRKDAIGKLEEDNGGFPTINHQSIKKHTPVAAGEGVAQQRITEWQDPNSMANQITRNQIQENIIKELKEQACRMDIFMKHLIETMTKRNPADRASWDQVHVEFQRVKNPHHDDS